MQVTATQLVEQSWSEIQRRLRAGEKISKALEAVADERGYGGKLSSLRVVFFKLKAEKAGQAPAPQLRSRLTREELAQVNAAFASQLSEAREKARARSNRPAFELVLGSNSKAVAAAKLDGVGAGELLSILHSLEIKATLKQVEAFLAQAEGGTVTAVTATTGIQGDASSTPSTLAAPQQQDPAPPSGSTSRRSIKIRGEQEL